MIFLYLPPPVHESVYKSDFWAPGLIHRFAHAGTQTHAVAHYLSSDPHTRECDTAKIFPPDPVFMHLRHNAAGRPNSV